MIPRILHRIWFGDEMPAGFVANGERWRELHPDWEICEWLDGSELPNLRNAALFQRAPLITPDWKRFRADLLRLELLHRGGGVYVDTDVEPLRPIDKLLEGTECFAGYSPNRGRNGERLLTNAVLGARPRHRLIAACIDRLPEAVTRYQGRPIAQMVGPWHLTRTYESQDWPDVTIFDEPTFYPTTAAGAVSAYTRHLWANSR